MVCYQVRCSTHSNDGMERTISAFGRNLHHQFPDGISGASSNPVVTFPDSTMKVKKKSFVNSKASIHPQPQRMLRTIGRVFNPQLARGNQWQQIQEVVEPPRHD